MPKKVYMYPTPTQARMDDSNSINQIVLRLEEHLPNCGWEITENIEEADIIARHATSLGGENIDVLHCHGVYPTYHYRSPKWHYEVNRLVKNGVQDAQIVTVPSQWVGDTISREFNIPAEVVNWAVDFEEWQGVSKLGIPNGDDPRYTGYTLWNKTRTSAVCDPFPIHELSDAFIDDLFVTTFARDELSVPANLKVTGRMPFEEMTKYIRNAGIYLSTTKETFGIGTLEALSCGVPILGFDFGGNQDIIQTGENGILVKPHDIQALIEGYKQIQADYEGFSSRALESAKQHRWSWDACTEKIAKIYDKALSIKKIPKTDLAIIIPCHNYAEYLKQAIDSALGQKFEDGTKHVVIVVDDASTDGSRDIIEEYENLPNFFSILNQENLGVAKTRNKGINISSAKYILCLDADDYLFDEHSAYILLNYLDKNKQVGVAYGRLGIIRDNGAIYKSDWLQDAFNPKTFASGVNQVPSCCMFRKKAWEQAGGYKTYLQPAEDAGLWLSIFNYGWEISKVTEDIIVSYRVHEDSLSAPVRRKELLEPRWRWQYPPFNENTREIHSGLPVPAQRISHPMRDYDIPKISVIIPVGEGHEDLVLRAIDSVNGQSTRDWECIVVWDSPELPNLPQKWIKLLTRPESRSGAGVARNHGLKYAKGEFVVFLDADDYLHPDFMEKTLAWYQATERYVYTSWYILEDNQEIKRHGAVYDQQGVLRKPSIHPITTLIPRQWVIDAGGFDEGLSAWEDTDLFIRLAILGRCGTWLPEQLLFYDMESGKRRESGVKDKESLADIINTRYRDWFIGVEQMAQCCGRRQPKASVESLNQDEMVLVQMITGPTAGITIYGGSTGTNYRRRAVGDTFYVYPKDVTAHPSRYRVVDRG